MKIICKNENINSGYVGIHGELEHCIFQYSENRSVFKTFCNFCFESQSKIGLKIDYAQDISDKLQEIAFYCTILKVLSL